MIDERKLIKYLRYNKYQFVLNVREEEILDKIIKAIDEQPKVENTENFKHFKMYSDSTLKSMSKDDLIDYIYMLYRNWCNTDHDYCNALEFIESLRNDIDKLKSNHLKK